MVEVTTPTKVRPTPAAYDCYRRFIQMYSDVVMEVGKKYFEELIDEMKAKRGVTQDVELTAEDLKELAGSSRLSTRRRSVPTSPPTPRSSSWAPSRPCSAPGTTPAPTSTAA